MRWAGYVAHMGEMRTTHKILVRQPQKKISLGRPGHTWRKILSGSEGNRVVGNVVDSSSYGWGPIKSREFHDQLSKYSSNAITIIVYLMV